MQHLVSVAWVTYRRSHSRDWERAQLSCLWSLCSNFSNCFLPHGGTLMSARKRGNVAVAKPRRRVIQGGWKAGWTVGLGGEWLTSWSLAGGQCSVTFLSCPYWDGECSTPSPVPQAMGWQAPQWMMPSWGEHWVHWRSDCDSERCGKLKKWAYGNLRKVNKKECKVLHLRWSNPTHHTGWAPTARKQLCRKGPRGPGGHKMGQKPTVCPCGNEATVH